MSGWVVIHEPDDDPARNWSDREYDSPVEAEWDAARLDRTCLRCEHVVVWIA